MAKRIICGPAAHLKTVRKLGRAYDRAIRAEESAPTCEAAWKLASASERALRILRFAQCGEAIPVRAEPRTARNMARGAFVALATFGRAVARAITAKAALVKAHAANLVRRAAKKVRASLRSALRMVARTVIAVVALAVASAKHARTTVALVSIPSLVTNSDEPTTGYKRLSDRFATHVILYQTAPCGQKVSDLHV